jgi:hypothetical protein
VPAKVVPVTVTGNGIVKRGTLLSRDSGDEEYRLYENGDDIRAVLLLDVDANDPDENVGPAAFSGEFNQNKIEEVMGITLDPAVILDAAEDKKIFIAPMNTNPEPF